MLNEEVAATKRSTHEGEVLHMITKYPPTVTAKNDYFTGKLLTTVLRSESFTTAEAEKAVYRRGDRKLPQKTPEAPKQLAAEASTSKSHEAAAPSTSKSHGQELKNPPKSTPTRTSVAHSKTRSSPKKHTPSHERGKSVKPRSPERDEGEAPGSHASPPRTPPSIQQQITSIMEAQQEFITHKVSLW